MRSVAVENNDVYHTIEFVDELTVDLEVSPKHWLERTVLERGTRRKAQIRPYVLETDGGPVEVADLFFADGTTARNVPFASFAFVD
jgi:hypothetical protein